MSNIDCQACSELRDYAPNFVQNGVTGEIALSLSKNTGLNPNLTVLHENCEDLTDVNDCLVGRMGQEVEAYESCDWKDYMKKLVPNLYELNKAMIAGDCGQWDRLAELCEKLEMYNNPSPTRYGLMPHLGAARGGIGTIATKNGQPLIVISPESADPVNAGEIGIGIRYATMEFTKCDNVTREMCEWLVPATYLSRLSPNVEEGDIVWYATKAEVQSVCSFSDFLWNLFTIDSFTWTDIPMADHKYAWFEITIDESRMGRNYITLVFRGTSYPNASPSTEMQMTDSFSPRMYRHNI